MVMTRSAVRICPAAPKTGSSRWDGPVFRIFIVFELPTSRAKRGFNPAAKAGRLRQTFGSSNLPSHSKNRFIPMGWTGFSYLPRMQSGKRKRTSDAPVRGSTAPGRRILDKTGKVSDLTTRACQLSMFFPPRLGYNEKDRRSGLFRCGQRG